jgi:hypothetical protein
MAIVQINKISTLAGSSIIQLINQANHGFGIGNVLRWNDAISGFVLAIADNEVNAESIGIVSAISSANNFSLLLSGHISSLSGLSAGQVYYLSDTISGEISASEPIAENTVSKPLLVAISDNEGYFFNYRGQVNGGTLSYSTINTITASSFALSQYQEVVLCDAMLGNISISLPDATNFNGKFYTIKKTDNSANTISVSGYSSGQKIDDNSFIVIDTQYDSFSLVSNGSNWFIT